MSNLQNSRLLRALQRQQLDRPPIWIMRQAGRYMPEYRAVRNRVGDFLTLCKTPELACEVTLLPIKKFGFDAAILFADILLIPDALGLGLKFVTNEGPQFTKVIASRRDITQLPDLDPAQDMPYIAAATKLIKQELAGTVPLIGFAGSPWTVATYMVEGQASKHHNKIRGLVYQDPILLHQLLARLTKQTIKYLQAQITAGADCIMLFDTWGGVLADTHYIEFSLNYMQQIVAALSVPVILFTKNGGRCLAAQAATGCAGLGLDWQTDLQMARDVVGSKVALQGNLDPCVLYADPDAIVRATQKILAVYGNDPGFIFNLGHGITPDVEPEKVQILVETVQNYDKNRSLSGNI